MIASTATTELPLLNPFATRAFRAGAIPYRDPAGQLKEIDRRFEQARYRGAIVGPHGSGKTTLLTELADRWRNRFAPIRWLTILRTPAGLQLNRARFPTQYPARCSTEHSCGEAALRELWIVDGFDALPWRDRLGLSHYCRRHRIALLVTAHRPCHLPTLVRTSPSLATFLDLADRLQGDRPDRLARAELEACYRAAQANFREAFFRAFDKYEQARRFRAGISPATARTKRESQTA